MSALEVVAKPEFGKAELEWLTQFPEKWVHGERAPAFTLVFPGAESAEDVVRHVEAVCAGTARIRFCLRTAMIVPEYKTGWFHVFLVPEEGFGAIIRLHDRLHHGPLARCWNPDPPYIPHLTVASMRDLDHARDTMAALNTRDLAITGRLEALEVQERELAQPRCIARIPFARNGFFH
jgi:2'-5' RNA ligase